MPTIRPKYRKGDKVVLIPEETTQYPVEYQGRVLTIDGVYDHECAVADMQRDPTGHPGFDSASGVALYGLSGVPFDVYEWEIRRA